MFSTVRGVAGGMDAPDGRPNFLDVDRFRSSLGHSNCESQLPFEQG